MSSTIIVAQTKVPDPKSKAQSRAHANLSPTPTPTPNLNLNLNLNLNPTLTPFAKLSREIKIKIKIKIERGSRSGDRGNGCQFAARGPPVGDGVWLLTSAVKVPATQLLDSSGRQT